MILESSGLTSVVLLFALKAKLCFGPFEVFVNWTWLKYLVVYIDSSRTVYRLSLSIRGTHNCTPLVKIEDPNVSLEDTWPKNFLQVRSFQCMASYKSAHIAAKFFLLRH